MQFDIVTIFPEFFTGPLDYGIVRRAREADLVDVRVHDLRAFTHDRHRTVDDRPFGGGEGMVLKPEPLAEALTSLGLGATTKLRELPSGADDPSTRQKSCSDTNQDLIENSTGTSEGGEVYDATQV